MDESATPARPTKRPSINRVFTSSNIVLDDRWKKVGFSRKVPNIADTGSKSMEEKVKEKVKKVKIFEQVEKGKKGKKLGRKSGKLQVIKAQPQCAKLPLVCGRRRCPN